MKNLRFEIFLLAIFWTETVSGDDGPYDFDQLTTLNGKVYEGIFVLDSDLHGLLFRHDAGIAKIDFEQLSMSLRMMYEPVASLGGEPPPVTADEADADADTSVPGFFGGAESIRGATITLTARNRVSVPWSGSAGPCRRPCFFYREASPRHCSRYHPALRLAIPACRAAAVDDFLITTGLVPSPPGVRLYRLLYNRADLLY